MNCQFCGEPATVHLTDIVDGQNREPHLCQSCAEKQDLVQKQELNLSAILQTVIGQHIGHLTDELASLTCPACGIKYMEFKAEGRLGCPHDYEVFEAPLKTLLQRIHRSCQHVGKQPQRGLAYSRALREIVELRQKLRQAVEAEAYEEAARLRDLLRQKEATDELG